MKELQEYAKMQKHKLLSTKKLRICEMCQKEYKIAANNQRFCGSLHKKEGCSWLYHQSKDHEYDKQRRLKDPAAARERYRL